MVERFPKLERAAQAIEKALLKLCKDPENDRVGISVNDWLHLEALIASDAFKGMSEHDRDDIVWKHLRSSLAPEDFGQIAEVLVMDLAEYHAFHQTEEWINRCGDGEA